MNLLCWLAAFSASVMALHLALIGGWPNPTGIVATVAFGGFALYLVELERQ